MGKQREAEGNGEAGEGKIKRRSWPDGGGSGAFIGKLSLEGFLGIAFIGAFFEKLWKLLLSDKN